MRNIIIPFLLSFLISCEPINKSNNQEETDNENLDEVENLIDTILVNDEKLLKALRLPNKRFTSLSNLKGDIIVPFEDFYFRLELLDINLDGYEDLRIYMMSNTPNECENYLFNPKDKTYRKIENCYLDIRPINGTKYFYSYSASGCADFDWESYLSKIENYNLINLGLINGKGCGIDEDEPSEKPEIEIYKINPKTKEEKLIRVLSYKDYIPKFEDKWKFIEEFWHQNNEDFEK